MIKFHSKYAPPLCCRAQIGGISEHFRQRHHCPDRLSASWAEVHAQNLAPAGIQLADDFAQVLLGDNYFHSVFIKGPSTTEWSTGQGLVIGNMCEKPLHQICETYDPEAHPIVGPLLAGGPAELVRHYNLPHEDKYADVCHLCYEARVALRARFPELLARMREPDEHA